VLGKWFQRPHLAIDVVHPAQKRDHPASNSPPANLRAANRNEQAEQRSGYTDDQPLL